MKKIKVDAMILASLIVTIFYSSTYPYIHKTIISIVSDNMIALNQIINCLSVVVIGTIWNKKKSLFKYYPVFCIAETIFNVSTTVYGLITGNIIAYYILDTLVFAMITRNIICGGTRLRAMRYKTEDERSAYDNNDNSACAIGTIIGSCIAMILKLDFNIMLIIATFGNCIDNIFYYFIYRKETKYDKRSSN